MRTVNEYIKRWLPVAMVVFAVVFTLVEFGPEVSTRTDVNDNIFQLGLLNRMKEAWENGGGMALVDHWVPNWAVGYPLPFYYSHLPHLVVVAGFKLLGLVGFGGTLVNFWHWWQLTILGLTPIAFYLGARRLGFSRLTAGFAAVFSVNLSTDGLYGIDVSSYAWRGYGLSLQAWCVMFLPLALGYGWQAVKRGKGYVAAVLTLVAALAAHLATGYIGLLSLVLIPLAMVKLPMKNYAVSLAELMRRYARLLLIFLVAFLMLSYWFAPLVFYGQYHAISFWDAPSKWFSYGFTEVTNLFLNGDLFDFGRIPVVTWLVVIGFLVAFYKAEKPRFRFLFLLLPFWIVFFGGRSGWDSLASRVPLLGEYHWHRFIIGVHLAGIYLSGVGASALVRQISKLALLVRWRGVAGVVLASLVIFPVVRQTENYMRPNREWLGEANQKYGEETKDFDRLVSELAKAPRGRIYAGRAGNWGKDFKVGPAQVYMALSSSGFETSGFLPETWSLNSDTEQFFNEGREGDYNLYNVRYLVTPVEHKLPDFAREAGRFGKYKLAEVETSGYFDLGYSDITVMAKKENVLNIVHTWLVSDFSSKRQFPGLVIGGGDKATTSNQIKMTREADYEMAGKEYNLFANPIFAASQKLRVEPEGKVKAERVDFDRYSAEVEVGKDCQECLVVFKMTYHPGWQARIDGRAVDKFMVFPAFSAVKVPVGSHKVEFDYRPSRMKLPLGILGVVGFAGLVVLQEKRWRKTWER